MAEPCLREGLDLSLEFLIYEVIQANAPDKALVSCWTQTFMRNGRIHVPFLLEIRDAKLHCFFQMLFKNFPLAMADW